MDKILLARVFGSYINPNNAYLVVFPNAKVSSVGNASDLGVVTAVVSGGIIEKIVRIVEYIELAVSPSFQDKLVEGMGFEKN